LPVKPIQQKDSLDRFYTKPEVATLCVNQLKQALSDYNINVSVWVEPSAGCGNFSSLVDCLSFDIKPQNSEITEQDWLSYNEFHPNCLVFGNPPFGNRNKLSRAFITKAISVGASVIAFILPATYNKLTTQKVFPHNWKLLYVNKLENNSFLLEEESYHVPCIFQIWVDSNQHQLNTDLREKSVDLTNEYFEFTTKDKADIFVFGAAPNKVVTPEEVNKNNRGYYLQCKKEVDTIISKFKEIDWKSKGNSSVSGGVAWFSKQEIVKIIKGD
jgi:hypothetical protein